MDWLVPVLSLVGDVFAGNQMNLKGVKLLS